MADLNFLQRLVEAIEKKTNWFDERALPDVLEQYRLLHSCVKNIMEFLLKKSLITPDPYKNEKKISDIKPPENTQFSDAERSVIMGTRLSDYDSTLDFLCNYYKFSISNLQLQEIRKLIDLNNSIAWNSFSANSNNINTRVLATLVLSAKQNCEAITASMVTDSVSKAGKALVEINKVLRSITDFQREVYKCNIRKNIFEHPSFNKEKADSSPQEELAQIKKLFTQVMGKIPFYSELIDEIINEDHADNKVQLQNALLEKLAVETKEDSKKEETINTKEILLAAVRGFGAMSAQISLAKEKIQENHNVLEEEHNSFMEKLKKIFRKAFNIEEKPVFYNVAVIDTLSDTKHYEKLNYIQFINELELKSRRYNSMGIRKSSSYERISQQSEEKILEYVNQQLAECNKLLKLLNGLDEFFKASVLNEDKSKIKGLKMEITAIKNSVVKVNQHRSEYTAYIEEEAQLRKLGIKNV